MSSPSNPSLVLSFALARYLYECGLIGKSHYEIIAIRLSERLDELAASDSWDDHFVALVNRSTRFAAQGKITLSKDGKIDFQPHLQPEECK